MIKYNILLFDDMDPKGEKVLKEKAKIKIAKSLEEDYLLEEVKDVDGIIIRANGKITRKLMEGAPKLKVIGKHGVGIDEQIDVQAATDNKIQVVSTPDANYESVAEQTIGFMIAISKKMRKADIATRKLDWNARYHLIGQELYGKRLGIIGFGKIGRRVAEIGILAFKMPILYYDKFEYKTFEEKYKNCKKVPLEDLLKNSDYISINIPYFPELHHLIGEGEIDLMKKSAYIINTSRGKLWDENSLYKALKIGKIAGAATDVYEEEPFKGGTKLRELDNMIFSPHMAAHTKEALVRMSLVAEDVIAVLEGKEPKYPVNRLN